LRAVIRLGLVEKLGDQWLQLRDLREVLGFTEQAARTFFALLVVMEILEVADNGYRVTRRATECLADGIATSRKPYLAMGTDVEVDLLIDLLQGKSPDNSVPLYGEQAAITVMDDADVAREIAFGLSSRARNFSDPLA
ncbi:unnamed protein product, partial [marine sediment metagenome]